MSKGFIGPVGDDIPTIIIIVLAISLFFAGFSHAMSVYQQKNERLAELKAALDVSRAMLRSTVLPEDPASNDYEGYQQAKLLADSYGVRFSAVYSQEPGFDPVSGCGAPQGRSVTVMSFLVARHDQAQGIVLDTLRVCVWK